jgi:hypothetical protein
VRPNTRFHPTPLCGDKIVAMLQSWDALTLVSI